MLVFLFPFFENLGSYVYDSMRARTVLFLKGSSAAIFSLRSCTACAHVLSLSACACPRGARGRPRRLLLSWTRRQRRKVDKCRVADKKQTNKQTDKHTLLFYRYRYESSDTHLINVLACLFGSLGCLSYIDLLSRAKYSAIPIIRCCGTTAQHCILDIPFRGISRKAYGETRF